MPVTSKSGGIQQRLLNHHGTFDTFDPQSSVSSENITLQLSVISDSNDKNDKSFNLLISNKWN